MYSRQTEVGMTLQWGRGVMPRKTTWGSYGTPRWYMLQWGRGVMPRKTADLVGRRTTDDLASMGPRRDAAENQQEGGVAEVLVHRFNGAAA